MTRSKTTESPTPCKEITAYDSVVGEYLVLNDATNMCMIADLDREYGEFRALNGAWQYFCKIGEQEDGYKTMQDIWLIQRIA